MARPEVNQEKYNQVMRLSAGDVILLTSGDKCIFDRCKQKDFLGEINGKRYSIFINSFDKIIDKADKKVIAEKIEKEIDKEQLVKQLNAGDKVKLTNGDIAEFVRIKRVKFSGIIKGVQYSIPFNMFDSVIEKADPSKVELVVPTPQVRTRKQKSIWCECDSDENFENAIYVEHYKGVNHGYICPVCKKFLQIG